MQWGDFIHIFFICNHKCYLRHNMLFQEQRTVQTVQCISRLLPHKNKILRHQKLVRAGMRI